MTSTLLVSLLLVAPAGAAPSQPSSKPSAAAQTESSTDEYGPFFEEEAVSETAFGTRPRRGSKYPILSVNKGAFCFVEDAYCKASLLVTGEIGVGLRIPASNDGPDVPYAQFGFRGGVIVRPLMVKNRPFHFWGVGVIGSWSRNTGSVTYQSDAGSVPKGTDDSSTVRIAAVNQFWLTRKAHALHLDLSIGAAQSEVLTSGLRLWGTHAEVALGMGGWAALFAGGDFLDRDTRIVFGLRSHGIAAAPIIAMLVAGLAIGGAL